MLVRIRHSITAYPVGMTRESCECSSGVWRKFSVLAPRIEYQLQQPSKAARHLAPRAVPHLSSRRGAKAWLALPAARIPPGDARGHLKEVQELMVHRVLQMTPRYARLAPGATRAAVAKLDEPAPASSRVGLQVGNKSKSERQTVNKVAEVHGNRTRRAASFDEHHRL